MFTLKRTLKIVIPVSRCPQVSNTLDQFHIVNFIINGEHNLFKVIMDKSVVDVMPDQTTIFIALNQYIHYTQ